MTKQAIHERGPKQIFDHQNCFACRPTEHKGQIEPKLSHGHVYPICSLVISAADGACEPALPLTDIKTQKDRIIGVMPCDVDLTDTDVDCPTTVLTHIGLDPNYMCWPDNATEEEIDMLIRNFKDCVWFINRVHCSPIPDDLAPAALASKQLSEAKAQVGTFTQVEPQSAAGSDQSIED